MLVVTSLLCQESCLTLALRPLLTCLSLLGLLRLVLLPFRLSLCHLVMKMVVSFLLRLSLLSLTLLLHKDKKKNSSSSSSRSKKSHSHKSSSSSSFSQTQFREEIISDLRKEFLSPEFLSTFASLVQSQSQVVDAPSLSSSGRPESVLSGRKPPLPTGFYDFVPAAGFRAPAPDNPPLGHAFVATVRLSRDRSPAVPGM